MGRYKALESGELYTVGWIAALPKEMTAALGMLDERHDKPKDFVKPASDTNAYRWGRIGDHNVVIASLAAGVYGTTSAATTAIQMLSSFPSIKVGLMVGIGAAIPGSKHDIRLGDVVVSQPHGQTGGVVQYDLGKSRVITEQGNPVKTFERVGFLRPPPEALLKALSLLKAEVRLEGSSLSHFLKDMLERHPRMAQSGPDGPGYFHQGNENDRLFEASYLHISDVGCNSCNPTRMIPRSSRSNPGEPEVHYGLIASGNKLVKDAAERDLISRESGGDCICLDMEAAGLINSFPCLVIRGICDYADSHKNDDWQEYAAGTAAAYAKEFLGFVDHGDLANTSSASEILQQISKDLKETKASGKLVEEAVQELRLDHHQKEFRDWLSAPDASTNHTAALKKRHKGTGLWFIHGEAFQNWKRQPSSFLWLHGIPGCGKTVLSSTIIEHLKSDTTTPQVLLYFYFDFNDKNKQTLENMLRSFVTQLYQGQTKARQPLDQLWKSYRGSNQQLPEQSLDAVLLAMLSNITEASIVIDALDESTTRCDVIAWLKSVLKLKSEYRTLVTARREEDIETAFRRWTRPEDRISIRESDIDGDIKAYVSHTVRHNDELERWRNRPDVQDEIELELVEKANGMFRWVACQLEALEEPLDYPRLRQALDNLPRTLYETYDRILDRIPKERMNQATTILNLLIWSSSTFTIDELVDAVAVDLDREPGFDPKNRMPVPREVLKLCSSLVAVSWGKWEKAEVVRLAHFSVQEYLLSSHVSKADGLLIDETVARAYTARLYLTYLIGVSRLWPGWASDRESTCSDFPLLKRSAQHWCYDAFGIETSDEPLWRLMISFFLERPKALSLATFIDEFGLGFHRTKTASPIPYASYGGLVQMVEYLIDRGEESADTDATALPTDLKEGLKLASWRGYDTTVQLLLDRGTDVNAGDGAALRKASQLGYDTTVQLLLDRGADVDAGNGAALKIASWSGHSTTVQLLLDRHANVNAGDGAALGEASAHGYDTIVQLLLDRGADINAGDSAALIMASQGGSEKVVQFLLDRGADIHARDGAALMKASKYGREAVVRLLLDRGMDANLQDGAALRLALKRERHTVVQLLLDRGADVNAQDGFALHEAVRLGRDIIVRLLLDGGADVNVRGKYGQTALMEALQREHHTITQLLLDRDASLSPEELEYALLWDDQGAKSLVSIILPYITVRSATHKNNMGRNLLHHAVVRELESVVQKCLDLSVDIRVRDGYGMTALDWAAAQGHLTISKMLLRAGSDVEEPNEHGWTPLAYLADLASWERRARSWERGRKRSWESSSEYDSVWERSSEGSQERSWDYNQEIDWEAQYRKCREGRGRPRRRRSC